MGIARAACFGHGEDLGKILETMSRLTRRSFLAASAAAFACPRLGAAQVSGEVDVAIVGAGAAGIAAARQLVAGKKSVLLLEAANRLGGRCITDTQGFGVPFDLGAHWIHLPDANPVAKLANRAGVDLYPAPPGQKIKILRRYAREGEMEDLLAALVRANRAIREAGRAKADIDCARAMPGDLGDWRATIAFLLGPFAFAKDLDRISAADFSRSVDRTTAAFCRQGFGTLVAKLAEGLTIRLESPATRISSRGGGRVEIDTPRGKITARAAIVTASTGALAAGKIDFDPDLPKRQMDAFAALSLGDYDRIILELPGNPLGLQRDDLVFEKTGNERTAAILANISGTTLTSIDVAGSFGRELAAQGEKAMIDFALEWLGGLFGSDMKNSVKRVYATQWSKEPWVLGAFSAASPGGQYARKLLMEPLRDRIFFAGEAVHETLWGTVGGAWESGERAAAAALKLLPSPAPRRPERPQRPQRTPQRRP